jgi:hypothetical protein
VVKKLASPAAVSFGEAVWFYFFEPNYPFLACYYHKSGSTQIIKQPAESV